jgi:hypothetical protein
MTPVASVVVPDRASTDLPHSHPQQQRDQLRRELLRRIIAREMRRQAIRITPH